MRVVITGATGLIGRRLVRALEGQSDDVTVLTRDVEAAKRLIGELPRFVAWDGLSAIDPSVFEGAGVVYHLAGEPVARGRWTPTKKRRIWESRELGTRAIVHALARSESKAALVSASAVGYYGSRGDEALTEGSQPGQGFLPEVCQAWEAEAAKAARAGSRVTMVRIGIVLAPEDGALAKMLPLFRTGLGGPLGTGKQWMPWIHIDDVVSLLRHAGETTPALEGPLNAAAPHPVTNREFAEKLAHAVGRSAFVAAPSLALRVVLGEMAEIILASQRVLPEKALRSGYVFRHPDLSEALAEVVASSPSRRQEVAA